MSNAMDNSTASKGHNLICDPLPDQEREIKQYNLDELISSGEEGDAECPIQKFRFAQMASELPALATSSVQSLIFLFNRQVSANRIIGENWCGRIMS